MLEHLTYTFYPCCDYLHHIKCPLEVSAAHRLNVSIVLSLYLLGIYSKTPQWKPETMDNTELFTFSLLSCIYIPLIQLKLL